MFELNPSVDKSSLFSKAKAFISLSSLSDKKEQANRISSIHVLRGIAAFSVVLFHFTKESTISLSSDNPLRLLGAHGHYGVQAFFVISGCVIPYTMYKNAYGFHQLWRFLGRRCIRIEIPYVATVALEAGLILVAVLTPWRLVVSDRLSWQNVLMHIGYLNTFTGDEWLVPVFWTLGIEFQYYILIALIYPLMLSKSHLIRALVLCAMVLSSLLPVHGGILFVHLPYFALGIILFFSITGQLDQKMSLLWMLLIVFFIQFRFGYEEVIVVILSTLTILFFSYEFRWSDFLGNISFSLYLVHVPIGGRWFVLTEMFIQSEIIKSIAIVAYIGLILLVSYLFYLWVEKPSMILSKRVKYM